MDRETVSRLAREAGLRTGGNGNYGVSNITELERFAAAVEANCVPQWISVDDRLPNNQQTVLIAYTTHWGKRAVTIGWHTRAKCLESCNFESEVDDEYDEEADTYYMKEQWVDESIESEYHYPICNVTHWMPLPSAPATKEES